VEFFLLDILVQLFRKTTSAFFLEMLKWYIQNVNLVFLKCRINYCRMLKAKTLCVHIKYLINSVLEKRVFLLKITLLDRK
jgi:hypothetical protein